MRAAGICALLLATAAGSAGAEPTGKIRVCRYPPHAVGAHDRTPIPIPAGTVFTSGDNQKTGDQLKPFFEIQTTSAVVLPPKPGCVVAVATFKTNPEGFALTTRYPTFLPSQLNVTGASIVGRIVADFR